MPRLALLCLMPLLCLGKAAAQQRVPPAPGCLDARQVAELRQPAPTTLALVTTDRRYYRIALAQACPGVETAEHATLLARDGWVCGQPREFLQYDAGRCPIAAAEEIDSARHAALARLADAAISTLPTVQVSAHGAPARRGFRGSYSYCFNPRHVRSWSEDPQGLSVDVSPRRSGGHHRYRIELLGHCPALVSTPMLRFESGLGIGIICGNAGDVLVASFAKAPPVVETSGPDLGSMGEVARRIRRTERSRCGIAAVYPQD